MSEWGIAFGCAVAAFAIGFILGERKGKTGCWIHCHCDGSEPWTLKCCRCGAKLPVAP